MALSTVFNATEEGVNTLPFSAFKGVGKQKFKQSFMVDQNIFNKLIF